MKQGEKLRPKLVEFLDWRWKQQIAWLHAELGEEATADLIGEPILLAYQFLISGDPDKAGMKNMFGGPAWGGSLYSSQGGGISIIRSNDNAIVRMGVGNFDPNIGELVAIKPTRNNGYGRDTGPKPPVKVPDGMTIAKAEAKVAEINEKMQQTSMEAGASVAAIRQTVRNTPRQQAGRFFREGRLQENTIKADSALEIALLNVELKKWTRIVEELGGDPNAKRDQIRKARMMFHHFGVLRCGDARFLSSVNANAEQCDALEKLALTLRAPNPEDDLAMETYIREVSRVLNDKQRSTFNQQIFRAYWYSERATQAFDRTKIDLTNEQEKQVADLADRYAAAKQEQLDEQRFAMRIHSSSYGHYRDESYLVEFAEEFKKTLEQLVGRENAKKLLGKPLVHNQKWKRPVKIPADMTLEKAEAEQKEVEERINKMDDLVTQEFGLGGPSLQSEKFKALELEYTTMEQRLKLVKRYIEELGQSQSDGSP